MLLLAPNLDTGFHCELSDGVTTSNSVVGWKANAIAATVRRRAGDNRIELNMNGGLKRANPVAQIGSESCVTPLELEKEIKKKVSQNFPRKLSLVRNRGAPINTMPKMQ